MFMNINIVKFLTASLLLALSTTSCLQLTEDQDSAYGYLSLSELSAEVEVYELVPTKSGTTTLDALGVTVFNQPNIEHVTFTLTGLNDYSETWNGALKNTLTLPVGKYGLKAVYNNPEEYDGLGEALYGEVETEISITSLKNESPRLSLPLTNALVAVSMAEGFDSHFVPSSGECVTFKSGVNEVKASVGKYVFVPTQQPVNVYVSGSNSAAVPTTLETNLTPLANTAYEVVLSAKGITMPSITLPDQQDGAWGGRLYVNPVTSVSGMSSDNLAKIVYEVYSDSECTDLVSSSGEGAVVDGLTNGTTYYVRAKVGNLVSDMKTITVVAPTVVNTHYNDNDSNLAGTNAVLDLKLNDFLKDKVEINSIVLSNGGTQMRTATASGTMGVTNDWPYLPQGNDYVLTVPHKLKDESSYTECKVSGVSVPAPEFKVNTGAYTSYSKYVSGDVSRANSCDAGTIYNLQSVTPAISASLLNNENYKSTVSKSVSLDNSSTSSETATDQSWGSHTVTASYTFAGTTCSDNHTLHITGLPYTIRTDDATPTGWTTSNTAKIGVAGDYMCMKNSDAYAISPKFYAPENVNVEVTANAYAYKGTSGSYSPVIYFSASSTAQKSGTGKTVSVRSDYPVSATFNNYSATLSFNTNVSQTCIYAYGVRDKEWWGADGFTPSVVVKQISIVYGN